MTSGLLRQAWRCYKDFGADESLLRLLLRLKLISEGTSLDFFIHDLESFPLKGFSTDNVREISKIEFGKFQLAEDLTPLEDFHKQFSRGSRLIAALEGSTIIGINWLNTALADLTHIRRPHQKFAKDTVYTYGLWVSPRYRSKGVGRLLKRFAFEKLKNEGFRFIFLTVYVRDIHLLRWHEKNGFQRWARVFYWKFSGKERRWTRLTKTGRKYPQLFNA